MPKIASSILLTILLLFSPSLSAQEETEQLQMQAFKWFPEGNYSGITYLNLTSAESRPEMKLFRQYWNIYGDYDPFDNFLPWPLEQYKVKVFANVARFGISKLTSEGAKQLRDNLRAGGEVRESGGEFHLVRENGFEITVCLYDDPESLIKKSLAEKQVALHSETILGCKVYKTTPSGAKLQLPLYFAHTGTGEVVIADNLSVLEAMLAAGLGRKNMATDRSYDYLWQMTKGLDTFWMYEDSSAPTKVKIDLAREAGDQEAVRQYQDYLSQTSDHVVRYFSLQNKFLRKGSINLYYSEEKAKEVYLKFKEWEGIDPADYNPREQDQNWYLVPLGTKHELNQRVYHQYFDMSEEYLVEEVMKNRKQRPRLKTK